MKTNTYGSDTRAVCLSTARLAASLAFILAAMPAGAYTESDRAPGNTDTNRADHYHRYLSRRVLRVAESINNLVTDTFRQEEDHGSEMTRRFYGNLTTAYQVEGSYIRMTPRLIMTEGDGPSLHCCPRKVPSHFSTGSGSLTLGAAIRLEF